MSERNPDPTPTARPGFLRGLAAPFIEITRRYKTPRVKMTKGVRIALFSLRIYLFLLVGILFLKFITMVKK